MKKIFLILLTILFVSGCGENKDKLKIEADDSRLYLTAAQVDDIPGLVTPANAKELGDQFAAVFQKYSSSLSGENKYALAVYTLFINETGEIDKIKRAPGKMMWPDQSGEELRNIENKFAEIFGGIKFSPALKDGKPQKYRTEITIWSAVRDSKLLCSLYSNIGGMKNEKENEYFDEKTAGSSSAPVDQSEYFVTVENPPEPIGGMAAIAANVKYPEIAKRAGIEGRVFIKAFINENGDVVKTDIFRGIGSGCDEAAANAVMKTKFKPGMQRGKAVKVQVAIPIIFKLK